MGQAVEGDLVGINLVRHGLAGGVVEHLLLEFLDGLGAGARNRLIGGNHDALDPHLVMDGLQGHQHLDGGAVGVGDDAALLVLGDGVGVDLGHHQGDLGVHAEGAGIVHHHRARGGGGRRELERPVAAGRKERHVDAGEGVLGQLLNSDLLAAKGKFLAHRALRGEQAQFLDREIPPFQDIEHGAAHGTGGAGNGNVKGTG